MDCIFVRHGIAWEAKEWSGPEPQRPLTDKGKKRTHQAALGLATMIAVPTHILSSPFARAKETAKIIQSVFPAAPKLELVDDLAVGASPERLLSRLRSYPAGAILLCVGHEPLLGATISTLLTGKATDNFPMKKAGAAYLEGGRTLMPGRAVLRWWLQPAQLRALRNRRRLAGLSKDQD